ncbi:hypothetical protein GQ473_06650 [archaeon]|nr:hypothetical protein [archaeon]
MDDTQTQSKEIIPKLEMNILQRAGNVIFYPKEYFSSIKDETDFETPIIYYLVFVFIPTLLITWTSLYLSVTFSFYKLLTLITVDVVSYVLFIVIMHLFVSLFGGKEGIINTLKSVIYSTILLIPILIIFVFSALMPSASLLFGIIAVIIGLYGLQLELWAFERLQNISQWRAFFAIIFAAIMRSIITSVLS